MDVELVRRKLVSSRTEAQRAIESGLVRVGTNAEPKASTLVSPADPVHVVGSPEPYVSRAGRKLEGALDSFDVLVDGLACIDVGASTGGFTDCLLQRGAASVVAVDVGYGQMHLKVRDDPRVTVVERTNIRNADASALGAPFDIVVADLSFISLRTVTTQIVSLGHPDTRWILLIKPQFEAGKEQVGRGGIVRDVTVREQTVRAVVAEFANHGLGCQALGVSSVKGTTGNVEFVAMFSHAPARVDSERLAQVSKESPK